MYSKMPTKPKICIFFRFGLPTNYLLDNVHHYLLDDIVIRFDSKLLYRQIVGIPMGTNCAPLVEDLFLFGYEGPLSDNDQANVIDTFNSTSTYIDDLLNINNL